MYLGRYGFPGVSIGVFSAKLTLPPIVHGHVLNSLRGFVEFVGRLCLLLIV